MSFEQSLQFGKIGESLIAKWFLRRGYSVLPVYEKEYVENKGPVLFCPENKQYICPDLLVFNEQNKVFWIEAKHKTAFTWHRNTKQWVTGIDIHHYENYLEIAKKNHSWPVYLLFLHGKGIAKDTPEGMESPAGLFGNTLEHLSKHEHHRHKNWGKNGMVYWSLKHLKRYANIEDVGANN